jgi:quinol-cytochrome oxidoreductase complex cytochrome b subunit
MVDSRTLRFNLTFGLGGSAAVLLLLLFSTGILLKFVYEPFPGRAYDSILTLQSNVVFGTFVRNIHYWSANLLLCVAFLHLLRVFFTGGFQLPRRFNWLIGVGLLFLAIASNITGYLLPWDQLAYWAITVLTGMIGYMPVIGPPLRAALIGGGEIGPATLSTFYALHTFVLPFMILAVLPFHFWRIRKAGGLVIPRSPDEDTTIKGERVESIPNLLLREVTVGLVVMAAILVLAALVDAPLGDRANPGLSPNPTKAPWYFGGVQEMLLHFHPLFSLFLIPTIVMGGMIALPYLRYDQETAGVWFASRAGRQTAIVATLLSLVVTPLLVVGSDLLLRHASIAEARTGLLAGGVLPFFCALSLLSAMILLVRKRYRADRVETVQAVAVATVISYAIMTLTNVYFRGEAMQLTLPF